MRDEDLQKEAHCSHALEWRLEDTCLHCMVQVIRSDDHSCLKIHRRFALSNFNQCLRPDPDLALNRKQLATHKNLSQLLKKNQNVSSTILHTLLDAMCSTDVADLAVEAVYRLYYHVLRDDDVLESILTHCLQKISSLPQEDAKEKWVPYLSCMQRLARVNPASVGLALGQNSKLEELFVEHLSDRFSEFVALHVVALLDPIIRSTESNETDSCAMEPAKRHHLMLQLGHLLSRTNCQQLQCAVLGFAHILWTKEENLGKGLDDDSRKHLLVVTTNGLKRVVLQSLPDIQMAALQVLDALLWKCCQLEDGAQMIRLLLEQDLAELVYDVLYCHRQLQLLEYALRCLHHLSRCPAFFQHRCIILGVEPLIRVIPQLLESNASNQGGGLVAAYAVHLLSDMLANYEGEESLLARISSEEGGFHLALRIALSALRSSTLYLETGGAQLAAALLSIRNVPVPLPVDLISSLIESSVKYLAPEQKKWKCETGKQHLKVLIKVLSAAALLVSHSTDDPCALSSSYSATEASTPHLMDGATEKLIVLTIRAVDRLINAFHQIDDDGLWSALFHLLLRMASGSQQGVLFVEQAGQNGLLRGCCRLRKRADVTSAADDFLTWWLAHSLRSGLPSQNPFDTIKALVRCIPVDFQLLADWLSRDEAAPFASKCAALILLYHVELWEKGDPFAGEEAEAILSSLGNLMLTRSPCDMDDPDLLRALWFLIARYSDGVHHESSKAFLHLVQWFQPDGAQLLEWLRHIFTPHLCLMQWAFGVKDIAAYLGSYMVLLWISEEDDKEGSRSGSLVQLCLDGRDDVLLVTLFDLLFHEEIRVSCRVASVLERAASQGNGIIRETIGRLIKYNVPRFLRLTDISGSSCVGLVGSLRLLCSLSSVTSEWRDPAILGALVSRLPRTLTPHLQQGLPLHVTLPTMDLWSWSCKYLTAVASTNTLDLSPSQQGFVVQIVMESRALLEFLDTVFQRDELPMWKDAAALVAALADFHHANQLEVIVPISVSTSLLVKKLTDALITTDGNADDVVTVKVIFQLLTCQLRIGYSRPAFLVDPSGSLDGTGGGITCIAHLWTTLQNWTLRMDPSGAGHLFECLTELVRFCRRSLPPDQFAALIAQQCPWNYLALLHGLHSPSFSPARPQVLQLAVETLQTNRQHLLLHGAHHWSAQLEGALKEVGHVQQQVALS